MSEHDPHDAAWYRERWRTLMDLLSVSDPEEVLSRVRAFQGTLADSSFDRFEDALRAIESMEAQLTELYDEKATLARAEPPAADADTYEQLQSLLAREDKLRRALGVTSTDAVVEMVEGLADQLDVLYAEREANPPAARSSSEFSDPAAERLESELGVSSPDAIIAMVNSLSKQLDELYADRERLTDANVADAEGAVQMLRSMQHQLEALYEQQEQRTEHGVENLDHALALIDSMEEQLVDLYAERRQHTVDAPLLPSRTLRRLDAMDDAALDDVPVGALCVDATGNIQRANSAALQWPGLSADRAEALVGTPFHEIAPPDPETTIFGDRDDPEPSSDTRFLYTYATEDTSATLLVQLHRPSDRSHRWILFRRL